MRRAVKQQKIVFFRFPERALDRGKLFDGNLRMNLRPAI
jgi:hypothetical protein